MKTMYKLFGIIVLVAVGFSMTACKDPIDTGDLPGTTPQEEADAFKAAHATILAKNVDAVVVGDEAAVNAALAAYNALSSAAKLLVIAEKTTLDLQLGQIAILKAGELGAQAVIFRNAYAVILAKDVEALVLADSAAVNIALAAYNALDSGVQALLTTEKAKLDQLLDRIEELEASATPEALAAAFIEGYASIINKDLNELEIADKTAVETALDAYGHLDIAVKDQLSTEKVKLDQLKARIEVLEDAEDFRTTYADILDKEVGTVAISDETDVANALAALEELNEPVKALLDAEKTKLEQLEAYIVLLKAAKAFTDAHTTILGKTVDNVAISDETAVEAALAAYDELSLEVKALLDTQKTLLDTLLRKIEALKLEELADAFRNDHATILAKTVSEVDTGDKNAVDAALAAFDNLDNAVKALLTEQKTKLDDLKDRIDDLTGVSVAIKTTTELWIADGMIAGSVAETLSATVTLASGTDDSSIGVTWTKSDDACVTIDSTGRLIAVSAGTATITATATKGTLTDGNPATATCAVTISTATAPTTVTAALPIIDNLDGGWYAEDNGIRQTAPFPFGVGDNSNWDYDGAYYTYTWGWEGNASITERTFDFDNKVEGAASLKMSFDLTNSDDTREASLGIACSPVNVNSYYILTFWSRATAEGRYNVKIETASGNIDFPFFADMGWNPIIIPLTLTANLTGINFQALNDPGYANQPSNARTGSLWIDDIRVAAEVDLQGAHFEDNGYENNGDDNADSGFMGWAIYGVRADWTRIKAADDVKEGTWIFNSSLPEGRPGEYIYQYPGTEEVNLAVGGGIRDIYLTASGINKPDTDITSINLAGDWGSNIGYVKFQNLATAPGTHQVNIFTNGPYADIYNKVILVKLNDNPAVIVSLPGKTGSWYTDECILVKQLVLGPFKGDGDDTVWVSGTIGWVAGADGGGWANIHQIDIKDAAE